MLKFYVYLWLRGDGTPYYVGKGHDGKDSRAFVDWGHSVSRPKEFSRILVQYYESEDEAFDAERFFISLYGRKDLGTGCLRNLTDGGEGLAGAIRTEEWKRKIGDSNRGKKRLGPFYPRTEEHRQQLRKRLKGNRNAIGYGRPRTAKPSAEEIAKRSAGIKAAWASGRYARRVRKF